MTSGPGYPCQYGAGLFKIALCEIGALPSLLLDVVGPPSLCSTPTHDRQWHPHQKQATSVGHRLFRPFGADPAPRKVRTTYP
jgi:hypothetical protein